MFRNPLKKRDEKIRNEGRDEGQAEALAIYAKIFEHYKLFVENRVNFNLARINIYNYLLAREQIETMQRITFGDKISVLLMTDHLYGYALGLEDYLRNSIDITVELVVESEEAQMIINQKQIDFFIIVGLFKNPNKYKIIQTVKKANKHVSVIMYESTVAVEEIRKQHCIEYSFDIIYPLERFVAYMHKCYKNNSI